jgi:hypothetical protein
MAPSELPDFKMSVTDSDKQTVGEERNGHGKEIESFSSIAVIVVIISSFVAVVAIAVVAIVVVAIVINVTVVNDIATAFVAVWAVMLRISSAGYQICLDQFNQSLKCL